MRITITLDELRAHRGTADDEYLTQELMDHFREALPRREPPHLTRNEFDRVTHWKLRTQYGRVARHFAGLTEEPPPRCCGSSELIPSRSRPIGSG